MRSLPKRICFAVVAAAWMCGCAGFLRSIEPPQVGLSDLRIQAIRHFETLLEVDLRVVNPNDFPLIIQGVACDLELNGQHFGSGVGKEGATISAFDTGIVSIVVYSSMIDLFRGFLKMPDREELVYSVEGFVRVVREKGGAVKIPFESEGRFRLQPFDSDKVSTERGVRAGARKAGYGATLGRSDTWRESVEWH